MSYCRYIIKFLSFLVICRALPQLRPQQTQQSDIIVEGNNINKVKLLDLAPQIGLDVDLLNKLRQIIDGEDSVSDDGIARQHLSDNILIKGDNNSVIRTANIKPQVIVKLDLLSPLEQTLGLVGDAITDPATLKEILSSGGEVDCIVTIQRTLQSQSANTTMIGDSNRALTALNVKPAIDADLNVLSRLLQNARCVSKSSS